jgi:hypothetical protein
VALGCQPAEKSCIPKKCRGKRLLHNEEATVYKPVK